MAPTTRGKLAGLVAALALFWAADAEDSCSTSVASTFQEEEEDQGLSLRQLRVHEMRGPAAGGAEDATSPPVVPEVWSASLKVDMTMGLPTHSTAGKFFYDAPHQTFKMTHQVEIMKKTGNVDTLGIAEVTNTTFGTACLPGEGIKFEDLFSWLPKATHAGQMVVDGKTCEAWQNSEAPFPMVACINPDNTPRHWWIQTPPSFGGGMAGDINYTFSEVCVGPGCFGQTSFKPTPACLDYPPKPCPDNSPIALETYRIDNPGPWTHMLGNRNSGDSLGSANFVCTQDASSTKIITIWRLQTFGSFGQYAMCNFMSGKNSCSGGTSSRVGRRSVDNMGAGAVAGQCSPNDDVGTQFSWPVDVECADNNNTLGTGGCTWKAQRVREVALSCVLTRGLLDQCGHGQDKEREATFLKAVADPEDGGCPSVD